MIVPFVNIRRAVQSIFFNTCLLLAPNLRVTIANELRDQVEMFQTLEYPKFLSTLIPIFMDILQNGNPVFQSGTPEQVIEERPFSNLY